MSWLFGIIQKVNKSEIDFKIEEECKKYKSGNFNFFIGGNQNTYFISHHEKSLAAVTGVVLKSNENSIKILNLDKSNPSISFDKNISGHFVSVIYNDGNLIIQNDNFGLRDLYYFENSEVFIFSTRIDFLTKYLKNVQIDFENLGSLWLTNFQLSNKSILKKIQRLGQNGKIIFDKNTSQKNGIFIKSKISNAETKFSNLLSKYCNPEIDDMKNLSIALSGGIDSRLILSELIKNKNNFSCHTLINEAEKDLEIAKELTSRKKIQLELLFREELNLRNCSSEIENIYKNILPTIPLTQLLDFSFYGKEYLKSKIIVDGGFGGFYRRQYFKKLYLNSFSIFDSKNNDKLKNLLVAPKPEIFNSDVIDQMQIGLNEDIKNLTNSFNVPQNKEELNEILDLISIRFMLPGIYGPGQTILDQFFISFMPLVQNEIVNLAMNIPINEKQDSILFKKLIKGNDKDLSIICLVNNNLKFPFGLNYKIAMMYLLFHRKFIKKQNFSRYEVLMNSKQFILDIVHSKEIKENPYLNHEIIYKNTEQFFSGNYSLGNYVDWLLTYVLWSKANNIE